MHGLSVLCRCKPFHKVVGNKTLCGIKTTNICGAKHPRKLFQRTNEEGWDKLPEDRCKRCQRCIKFK